MSKMCRGHLGKGDVQCLVYSSKDTAVNVVGPFTTMVRCYEVLGMGIAASYRLSVYFK